MAVNSITLTDPVSGYSAAIMPAAGVSVKALEVEPAVRVVSEDRVFGDGAVDTSLYLTAGAVTLTLLLTGTGQAAFMDTLGPLLHPSVRPVMIVSDDEWLGVARQLTLRFDSASKARSDRTNWPVQLFWAATDGVWEAMTPAQITVPATVPSTTGLIVTNTTGLHISAANGLDIPPTSSTGEFVATDPGTAPSQWTGQLLGPCTGPKLANDTTGLTINFTDDMVLAAGDFIMIDTLARSANLNGDPTQSVLLNLDFGATTWWQIQPGTNLLRYYPSAGSGGAQAVITYSPAYMT